MKKSSPKKTLKKKVPAKVKAQAAKPPAKTVDKTSKTASRRITKVPKKALLAEEYSSTAFVGLEDAMDNGVVATGKTLRKKGNRRRDMLKINGKEWGPIIVEGHVLHAFVHFSFHPNHPAYSVIKYCIEDAGMHVDAERVDFHHKEIPISPRDVGVLRASPAGLPHALQEIGFVLTRVTTFTKGDDSVVIECQLRRTRGKNPPEYDETVTAEVVNFLNETIFTGNYYLFSAWRNPSRVVSGKKLPASVSFNCGTGNRAVDEPATELVFDGNKIRAQLIG